MYICALRGYLTFRMTDSLHASHRVRGPVSGSVVMEAVAGKGRSPFRVVFKMLGRGLDAVALLFPPACDLSCRAASENVVGVGFIGFDPTSAHTLPLCNLKCHFHLRQYISFFFFQTACFSWVWNSQFMT